MKRKGMRTALLMLGLAGMGAAQAHLSCIEIGQFVEGVAQARDRHEPEPRAVAIVKEDDGFTTADKALMVLYVDVVYRNSDIPPKALSNIAIDTCYRSGAAGPPLVQ